MPDNLNNPFACSIAKAVKAAELPKPQRMKQHRANLQALGFHEGVEGVARYKEENAEAKRIQVRLNAIAYEPKPKGYDAALASLAERWLCSPSSLATTNSADVVGLNERLGTSYPPGKHFSDPLSKGRLKKIKAVFSRHCATLDLKTVKTMSGVKAAARAFRTRASGERRLGQAGVISGDTLVINNQAFTITRNGNRECIRVVVDGERQRIYLSQIEWLADLLIEPGVAPLGTTTERSIGKLAYPLDPLENAAPSAVEISESAYPQTNSLKDRIAARLDAEREREERIANARAVMESRMSELGITDPLELPEV